jgi:serine/threonine protein kinase
MVRTVLGALTPNVHNELPKPAAPVAKEPLFPSVRALLEQASLCTDDLGEQISLGEGGMLTIGDMLGGGGFGNVYRGRLDALQEEVAVKVIRHEPDRCDAEDVSREARAHDQLFAVASPPRELLVELLHHLTLPQRSILVLELVRGIPLSDHVVDGALSEAAAVEIARPLAHALAYCHEQGVAHLDIKPENVLVDATPSPPRVKLIDYGCADLFDPHFPDDAWVEGAASAETSTLCPQTRRRCCLALRLSGPQSAAAPTTSWHPSATLTYSPYPTPQLDPYPC